jgi:hypothetical protein
MGDIITIITLCLCQQHRIIARWDENDNSRVSYLATGFHNTKIEEGLDTFCYVEETARENHDEKTIESQHREDLTRLPLPSFKSIHW